MITIICGSRHCTDYDFVARAIAESGFIISYVLEGRARGVDMLAKKWARAHDIPYKEIEAAWFKYGKAAGPIRNQRMAKEAIKLANGGTPQCIAIMRCDSVGTKSMVNIARSYGFNVFVKEWIQKEE